ncbi:MAG TPA: SRPBCC family protein [Gemmatimonadaceae bacterium]
MNAKLLNGNTLHAESSAEVGAAAHEVYRFLADYPNGHLRIVPPQYFANLKVEEGGYGEGTVLDFDMRAFGSTQHARVRVSEPEPGRRLIETEQRTGAVTSFNIEPLGTERSRVTIAIDMPVRAGLLGWIERLVTGSYFRRVFSAELVRLDSVMTARLVG